jgi:hypothetical protein
MDNSMFAAVSRGRKDKLMIRESWAESVETVFTNERFGELASGYLLPPSNPLRISHNSFRQRRNISVTDEYSQFPYDLIDTYNQSVHNTNTGPHFRDNVSGYSLADVQWAINDQITLDGIKNRLMQRRPSWVTETDLNELFEDYIIVADGL